MRALVLAIALMATASAGLAQQVVKPGNTFGMRGLGLPQATGFVSLNEFRPDAHYEPMLRYVASPRLGRLTNYVGYLDVLTATPGASLQCTATLITANRILTNAHCVPTSDADRAIKVEFTLGYLTTYDRSTERSFAVKPTAIARDDDLDWAVLQLDAPVPDFVDPGFTVRAPRRNEPLLVVGHPLLQPLHVTQAGCTLHPGANSTGHALYHLCDTEKGHSGSLLFSADDPTQIVGLHKKWGSDANVAIRLASLDLSGFRLNTPTDFGAGSNRRPADTENDLNLTHQRRVEIQARLLSLAVQSRHLVDRI